MTRPLPLMRLPWLPVQWTGFFVAKYLVLGSLGLIVCALFCRRPCQQWPRPARFIWGTEDDGNPARWGDHPRPSWADKRRWLGRYWYCAIRNPATGFNRIFNEPDDYKSYGSWLGTAMEPHDLMAAARTRAVRWRVAGWMDGIRIVLIHGNHTYSEIWIGWKIGSPVPGVGITAQCRLRRPLP